MEKLCLLMPAYNEEKRIGRTLEAYSSFLEEQRKKGKISYELCVVINNTRDKTEEIVKKYVVKNPHITYLNLPQKGKGNAIIQGFNYALQKDFSLIGYVDADMATEPQHYWRLVEEIKGADAIIASRYEKNAVIDPRPTLARLFAKRLFNMWTRFFLVLPFNDTQCGAKLFTRNALRDVVSRLSMSQWAFDVELLYLLKKQGRYIKSVPTVWKDKEYSTINFWQAGPWMALGVVRLRLLHSPFKRFITVYDRLIKCVPH